MTLLDTNVLLDIATADPVWLEWSENQIRPVALEETGGQATFTLILLWMGVRSRAHDLY